MCRISRKNGPQMNYAGLNFFLKFRASKYKITMNLVINQSIISGGLKLPNLIIIFNDIIIIYQYWKKKKKKKK